MASLVPVLVLSLYSYCHYTILKVQIESWPTCIKNSGVQEFDFYRFGHQDIFAFCPVLIVMKSSHHHCL